MSINIWTDSMQHAALLGKPVLFTNWLIQRDIIPDGWYCYDLRGTHKSPSTRTTLVDHAADYHAGTVLSPIPLKHEGTASRRVNGTFYLLGEEMTLEQFCEEHDLAYPQDNREFVLRPASLDEVGLFYSEEKLDEALGTVGHLRMDFGHGGAVDKVASENQQWEFEQKKRRSLASFHGPYHPLQVQSGR